MPSPLDPRAIEGQDPDLSAPARTGELERRLAALERMVPRTTPTLVSALPGTPYDRQEVYYLADATNGVVWHLRYRAAATGSYKWEYLGGSSLSGFNGSPGSVTCTTQFVTYTPANSAPITLPLAGDYLIRYGFRFDTMTAAGNDIFYGQATRSDGGGGIPGINEQTMAWNFFGNLFVHRATSVEGKLVAGAAGSTVTPQIASFTSGQVYALSSVWIIGTPIRVG